MPMTDEAQKALDQLKVDLKGEIVTDIREQLAGVISSEVVAKIEEANKSLKPTEPTDKQVAESNLKYFKAKFLKDVHGEATEDLKLGKKDLDTTTDGSGDELVPDGYGNEVMRIAQKVGQARNNARIINLPTKIYTLPTMGDATATRTNEKAVIGASSPVTGGITFTAQKLAGMVIATTECIEDANVDVMNWISQLLGEAIAYKEDYWAFRGLDTGEGLLGNATAAVKLLDGGKNTYAESDLSDLLGALGLMDEYCVGNAKWLWSFNYLTHLMGLKDTAGRYLLGNPAGAMPTGVWGLPYITSPVMPKTTDEGSQASKMFACAYDPRYLMIGDKRSLSLEFSKEATVTSSDGSTKIDLFSQDMVAIKVTERIDIQVANPAKSVVLLETSAS